MQSAAKAQALIRGLKDKIQVRLPSKTIRQQNSDRGWPMLFISNGGNEAEGQSVIVIRISNVDMVSRDVFGNHTYAYTPDQLEFGYELNAAPGTYSFTVSAANAT